MTVVAVLYTRCGITHHRSHPKQPHEMRGFGQVEKIKIGRTNFFFQQQQVEECSEARLAMNNIILHPEQKCSTTGSMYNWSFIPAGVEVRQPGWLAGNHIPLAYLIQDSHGQRNSRQQRESHSTIGSRFSSISRTLFRCQSTTVSIKKMFCQFPRDVQTFWIDFGYQSRYLKQIYKFQIGKTRSNLKRISML